MPTPDDVWLIDEARPPGTETARAVASQMLLTTRGASLPPRLAIRFKEIVIHDNRKWFGEADVRLDALVVHGGGQKKAGEYYVPGTFRFARITDGARLPLENLLVFHGRPRHFLDFFVTVSRDRQDSDDLAELLRDRLNTAELQDATQVMLGLAVAAPQVAAITTALGAAALLGKTAYEVLRHATGATIGLYRSSWLEITDRFGVGFHPEEGLRRVNDLSFRFEVIADEPGSPAT
jgi:hypothetical protein